MIEGGGAKPKESGLASDLKQPEVAGAPQGGVAEPHAVAQNQAQAGDRGAEVEAHKVLVQAPYKEDVHAAAGGESHKQSELGARGVPLGKKRVDDGQPVHQNDQAAQLKDEERSLDKEKEKIENLKKEELKIEVQARLEKERIEGERLENLAREQELEEERLDKDKERRKKLAAEQELEKERAVKEKLTQEKAAEERLQQEIQKADNEILERARKEMIVEEAEERLAHLERAVVARNAGKAAQGAEREDGEALKTGGRDLKEEAATQADPREGVEDGALRAKAHPQGSHERVRDQGEMDLRRRRRALGPKEAGGPPRETRGVPGLEPLLELGGSDLHVALEEQLLAGAMVHSRQIKQVSEDEGAK